ncbi:glycosyltransferase family 4 protein [Phragmitibacter flavus]|nr:glycosyltransferase family 4 protein [Phragmitibacter flavus]
MPARIAYLYSRYPVVSQTFCDSEMLALEALGFELEVVSLNPPPDSFRHERLDRLQAEIHYPAPDAVLNAQAATTEFEAALGPLIREHDEKYGKGFKAEIRARNAWHAAKRLRKLGIGHVHVHFANRATHSALFLKRLGFTFSFTAHAQDFMVDLGSDDLLREMVDEAAFVVTVSDFSRQLLLSMCPGHDAKTVRIYNGIELNDFPYANARDEGALRVVSVGRLIEFKGFQHLIGAVRLLKDQGVNIQARIVGEGPLRASLEALIASQEVASQVTLLGPLSQENIKRELAAAHVFVHPGIVDQKGASDILPTVITEAMACCLPVVSTTVAGIPEMVVHGETGLLTEPGDERQLADALIQMMRHPSQRREMGRAGRCRAETRFMLDGGDGGGTARQIAQLFERTMEGREEAPRVMAPVAYFIEAGDLYEVGDLPVDERLRCIAAGVEKKSALPAHDMEYVPDAVVLESLWLRYSYWRQQVEKLRSQFGDAITGENFYRDVRRAFWLAENLPKRGVKHLHAFRSNALVTVWLWNKITGLSISAAIEENPTLSRSLLQKLLAEIELTSIADPKLADASGADALQLLHPPDHRTIQMGPIKLKKRVVVAKVDRKPVEKAWLERILQHLHA